jgi:hypothetical protein
MCLIVLLHFRSMHHDDVGDADLPRSQEAKGDSPHGGEGHWRGGHCGFGIALVPCFGVVGVVV